MRSQSTARTAVFEWDIGCATASYVDGDGIYYTKYDAFGEQLAQVAAYESHTLYGFLGRALTPTIDANGNPAPATANQILYAHEGGTGHALVLENPSVLALLPTVKPGETLFYGPLGQFWRGMADGSFTCSCPAPAGSGQPDFVMTIGPSGLVIAGAAGSSMRLDGSGWHVTTAAGATIDLGGVSGLPGPLSALASSCAINASQISLAGNATIGAGLLGIAPGVNGTFLLAKLAAYDAAFKAIAACLNTGISPPGVAGGPVTFATLSLVVSAVAACIPATPPLLYTDANATY